MGCGDGTSTRVLRERGYRALGVDPAAPDEPGFLRAGIEELDLSGEFDAAVAIRSLHHVHDLEAGVDALADALRPEARLVVFEFAIEAVDGAALRWCDDNGLRRPPRPETTPEVTPLAAVRIALERRFRPLDETPTPYHALEAGRPGPRIRRAQRDRRRAAAAGRLAAGLRTERIEGAEMGNWPCGGVRRWSAFDRGNQPDCEGGGPATRLARPRTASRSPRRPRRDRAHARLPLRLRWRPAARDARPAGLAGSRRGSAHRDLDRSRGGRGSADRGVRQHAVAGARGCSGDGHGADRAR